MMTPRERAKAVMNFRKPDVLPWMECYYVETILKWIAEGLPVEKVAVVEDSTYREGSGSILVSPTLKGFSVEHYFGSTSMEGLVVPIDFGPLPRFRPRVLKRDPRSIDWMNEVGQSVRKLTESRYEFYSMPMFLEYPVKDRESWERYKERLNPEDIRRYPRDWQKDDYIKAFEEFQYGVTQLSLTGFYGFGAQLMGIANFTPMFYKDPELMHDMVEYWEYFVLETMRDAVEALKDRIDMVYLWEDLASKPGPNISPRIYREFLLPHYKKVTEFLRKNKTDRIMMDCDGNITAILDLAIEAGIAGTWPLEVNSGMDAVSVKKRYGDKLFLMGNLDKRAVIEGGQAMRYEIDSKLPILKEMGGYMPGIDHEVPPEISLHKYHEYAEYIKRYLPL